MFILLNIKLKDMIEIWRDIKGYDGLYQVSNLGRVKNSRTDKLLKPNTVKGYLRVCLYKNGKRNWCSVHCLVAEAFIPNPDNLPTVDHINRIKTDNRVENLRWADMKLQCKNSDRTAQKISTKERFSKPVEQYTKNMIYVAEYSSTREAEKQTGIKHISECCQGKYKTAGGYIWRYVTENPLQ